MPDEPKTFFQESLLVDESPSSADVAWLEERLYEFNVAATGIADGRLLSIMLRAETGEIYAGLYGHTWGACCEIKSLWIASGDRGRGLGSRLLAEAEREALRRGCRQIVLTSHSFQAPSFYEKLGFARAATIEGYPIGHSHIVLTKRLVSPEIASA